jgi:UDP-N-acetylglucosamine:LPS N-acetylglucosamine transferase
LAEAGASLLLNQTDLTPARLGEEVERLLGNAASRSEMARRALSRGKPEASADIVSNLLTLVA